MLAFVKVMAVCSIFASMVSGLNLLADAAEPFGSWVNPIINLVTTGGFGAMLWYLITKRMPENEKAHREERIAAEALHRVERDDSREKFCEEIKSISEESHRTMKQIIQDEFRRRRAHHKGDDDGE